MKPCITYRRTKLSTQFRVNIVYFSCCPNVTCNETYVGETERRIEECVMDHNKRDKCSPLLKHARDS